MPPSTTAATCALLLTSAAKTPPETPWATRTVLDIGGQDTKAIRVTETGEIGDFCMNDKCAAGTGRFLGAAAAALEMPLGPPRQVEALVQPALLIERCVDVLLHREWGRQDALFKYLGFETHQH